MHSLVRPPRRLLAAATLSACLAVALPPVAAVAQQAQRPLRLADYAEFARPVTVVAGPDGRIVYEVERADSEADRYRSSLWQLDEQAGRSRLLAEDASAPAFSPDGRYLGFLRERQVWALPLGGGEPWRLTGLPEGVEQFDWAPDGSAVVVVSRDPREPEEALLPAPEEAAQTTTGPVPQTLPDAGEWQVAVEAEVPPTGRPEPGGAPGAAPSSGRQTPAQVWVQPDSASAPARVLPRVITRLQFKRDGFGYLSGRRSHLYLVAVDPLQRVPQPALRLTEGPFDDADPSFSPDGRWIAFVSNRTPEPDANNNVELWVVPAAGGRPVALTDSPGPEASPRWAPDGAAIAYLLTPQQPPVYANPRLMLLELTAGAGAAPPSPRGQPLDLTAPLDRPVVSPPRWSAAGDAVYVLVEDRGAQPLLRLGLERGRGGRRGRWPQAGTVGAVVAGPRVVQAFALRGGAVIAIVEWGTQPPELFEAPARPLDGPALLAEPTAHVQPRARPPAAALRRLTDLNGAWLGRVRLSEPEPLRYRSEGEVFVEGWLLRPAVAVARPYPLVVRVHGGPFSQYTWGFDWQMQYLAARGYAVLYVNPRGSSGYGEEFAYALWADWGGPDGRDLLAGIDHLVERGIADPDRLGVGGWSYGGLMTNYLITHSDRFRAAVSGASEADYLSCYGTDDIQRWWEDELGVPYEPANRARYLELSPILSVQRVITPTLFVVGDQDWRTPASQSEQMYAQLRRRQVDDGGPDTALVLYPGQSHSSFTPGLTIDLWRRTVAWYDRYLLGRKQARPLFGARSW